MAVVATGFFDGVHTGHRRVIMTLVSSAREREEEAVVVTFANHPRAVLQQDARSLRLLSSPEEKKEMLCALGVDRVEILNFTREFAAKRTRTRFLKRRASTCATSFAGSYAEVQCCSAMTIVWAPTIFSQMRSGRWRRVWGWMS